MKKIQFLREICLIHKIRIVKVRELQDSMIFLYRHRYRTMKKLLFKSFTRGKLPTEEELDGTLR